MELPSELAAKIGDLLIRSELLTTEMLQDGVNIAEKMSLSLGRVLEMNGHIKEHTVDAALLLRDRVEMGQLKLEDAIKALEAVGRKGIDLDTALRQLKRGRTSIDVGTATNKVGDLMSAAGIISPHQLKQGLYDSLNTRLPLGMTLVQKNMILVTVLKWCLQAQELIDSGILTNERAAQALRVARTKNRDFNEVLLEHGVSPQQLQRVVGIGELLVLASTITESQLLAAREIGLVENKKLEVVLLECGMASENVLDTSVQLLSMIGEGILSAEQAATIVRKLCRCKSCEEAIHILNNIQTEMEAQPEVVQVMELIAMCRLLSPEQLAEGIGESRKNKAPLMDTLVTMGTLPALAVSIATDCKRVIDSGAIDLEQGTIAFLYAVENETSFSDALNQFGWNRQLVLTH